MEQNGSKQIDSMNGLNGSENMQPVKGAKEEDLERKKKKEEKAKEKEAKKLKASLKAEAAKAAQNEKVTHPTKATKVKESKKPTQASEVEVDFVDPPTTGKKKQLASEMAKSYNPNAVEAGWYQWWEKAGFFVADPLSKRERFVIVVPPPNVTGALHIGHGLACTIEDTIVRWHRMRGFNTLWVPGVDHAGISTQTNHCLWYQHGKTLRLFLEQKGLGS